LLVGRRGRATTTLSVVVADALKLIMYFVDELLPEIHNCQPESWPFDDAHHQGRMDGGGKQAAQRGEAW